MDDRFLEELRRDPPPGFARSLREKLRAQEEPRRAFLPRLAPALAGVAAAVLAVALFTLPSVRASAQALLDLFRVRTFAAVPFDESRLEKLEALQKDHALLVFDKQEVVREPGPNQYFPNADAAGAAAGFAVAKPTYLPNGLVLDSALVQSAGEARVAASESKLRALLDRLDLRDVTVPSGIDGRWVEIRKPPVVIQRFKSGRLQVALAQATSPEVSVPAGVDVPKLAEIGLRVLGLDAGEARRIANATDWRSTLMIPVPMNASTFRQVTVHGQPGLLITTSGSSAGDGRHRRREGTLVLWTENGRVFALDGNLGSPDAMQMAESVR